jgi:HK97 family phage prohead protease
METLTKDTNTGVIKYKSGGGHVKDVDLKTKTVTGYYNAFGNVDSDRDMSMPGCFAKSISERGPAGANKIVHLKQHNWLYPVGKPAVLKEDAHGLYFETPFVNTTYGEDMVKLYEAQIYKEHSFGFDYVKMNPVKAGGEITHWEILEYKMYEGSTVVVGANQNTPFTGFKSNTEDWVKELIADWDVCTAILKQRNLTDETYIRALRRLDQIKSEFSTFNFKPGSPLKVHKPELMDLSGIAEALKQYNKTINI